MSESKKGGKPKRAPPVIDDERFKHVLSDPVFRRVPKKEKKVDIDKRFQSMFHDKKFKLKYSVDKRGRPIDLTTNEDLRQYYNLVEDEEQDETVETGPSKTVYDEDKGSESDASNSETKNEDEEIEGNVQESDIIKRDTSVKLSKTMRKKLHDTTLDFARGDGVLAEDSSDDSESTEDELEAEDTIHAWGELDRDAERTEESTNRLALCNVDWDRLKAVDLMVLFHSFLPPGGVLKSINIYTSEYGKERLAYEEAHGPMELKKSDGSESESDKDEEEGELPNSLLKPNYEDEEGDAYHMEKLRKYQLNRLKYFYAVLEFDTVGTAEKVYNECDGMEYESSATRLDLRFIPDDMTFEDTPTDSCDTVPLAEKYRPRFFTTTALQQAKVTLTWDETDPLRRELTQKVHDPKEKIDDEDLRAYLASSESEESENDLDNDNIGAGNSVDKYRALLDSIENKDKKEKEKDVEMEITWGVGLKQKTESLVKKKMEERAAGTLTPWEEILAKKKEKRKLKKTQLKLNDSKASDNDNEHEDSPHEGQISDDDVDVDMNDPFFREEIESNEIMKTGSNKKNSKKSKNTTEKNEEKTDNSALELLLMDDTDNRKHFNFKKIVEAETETKAKKKRKNRKVTKGANEKPVEDNFEIDVADNRFSALFSSHHYNVDPSDPSFKKTKAMEAIMQEKQKRRSAATEEKRKESAEVETEGPPHPKVPKNELAYLVKSVKRNTEMLKRKGSKRK